MHRLPNPPIARLLGILLLTCSSVGALAQENLVKDGSFEEYRDLPCGLSEKAEDFKLKHWKNPAETTPDYYSLKVRKKEECEAHPFSPSGIGRQNPHGGYGMVGIVGSVRKPKSMEWHEYVSSELRSSLKKGTKYNYRMYVSLAEAACYSESGIGIYVSSRMPKGNRIIAEEAQGQLTTSNVVAGEWVEVSGTFEAKGGERYVTIGNFNKDKKTETRDRTSCNEYDEAQFSYYYIDDVAIWKEEEATKKEEKLAKREEKKKETVAEQRDREKREKEKEESAEEAKAKEELEAKRKEEADRDRKERLAEERKKEKAEDREKREKREKMEKLELEKREAKAKKEREEKAEEKKAEKEEERKEELEEEKRDEVAKKKKEPEWSIIPPPVVEYKEEASKARTTESPKMKKMDFVLIAPPEINERGEANRNPDDKKTGTGEPDKKGELPEESMALNIPPPIIDGGSASPNNSKAETGTISAPATKNNSGDLLIPPPEIIGAGVGEATDKKEVREEPKKVNSKTDGVVIAPPTVIAPPVVANAGSGTASSTEAPLKPMPVEVLGRKVEVQKHLVSKRQTIKVKVWDGKEVDGDIVTLVQNDSTILENYTLTKEPLVIEITLKEGANFMTLHALNLGRIPPNTAQISLVNVDGESDFELKSNMKSSGLIQIDYQK